MPKLYWSVSQKLTEYYTMLNHVKQAKHRDRAATCNWNIYVQGHVVLSNLWYSNKLQLKLNDTWVFTQLSNIYKHQARINQKYRIGSIYFTTFILETRSSRSSRYLASNMPCPFLYSIVLSCSLKCIWNTFSLVSCNNDNMPFLPKLGLLTICLNPLYSIAIWRKGLFLSRI